METQRLLLRRFTTADADAVTRMAGDIRVSEMTSNIPYPYTRDMALQWLESVSGEGDSLAYAVVEKQTGHLMGCVSFASIHEGSATLGYWLGNEYWGRGYATEAMAALMAFARKELGIHRFEAVHLIENARSRSVLLKLGLLEVGTRWVAGRGGKREVVVYESPPDDEALQQA